MNFRELARPQPWRKGLRRTEHRPIQVCESCRQQWPCDEERERAERQRRNTQIIETILAERKRSADA